MDERWRGIPVPAELRPRGSTDSAPPRRPGSIRRTSTLDASWPTGIQGATVLDGRARDLLTMTGGDHVVLAEARLAIVSKADRSIEHISSTPERSSLQQLIGDSSMSGFRRRLAEVAGSEVAAASPLHLLLDDVPGATLVSGSAFQPWYEMKDYLEIKSHIATMVMADVCTGYQSGSSALNADGTIRWGGQHRRPTVEINDLDDPLAWHGIDDHEGVSFRRARRLDVWADGDSIHIDGFYQDSAILPDGSRQAIHEYTLTARGDVETLTLQAIAATPRVLPYDECPLAVLNTSSLVGHALHDLRPNVLTVLAGPAGCTHLNDTMRSLADVPGLVDAMAAGPTPRP